MKDERVLAYCNMFGVLGAIPSLLTIVPEAKETVKNKNISVGFLVKDGPSGTLSFKNGEAKMQRGIKNSSITLYFSSCEKFNAMIDGKGNPLPISGFWHIGFLLGGFTKLTDMLSEYLRPSEEKLLDREFFERSTKLMLHVIAGAVAEVGNHDKVGRFSASNIVDGVIKLSIDGGISLGVCAKGHHLTALHFEPKNSFSEMRFDSIDTARALFDGKINAVVAVGMGKVSVSGMISQVDNINRILDRVSVYLA